MEVVVIVVDQLHKLYIRFAHLKQGQVFPWVPRIAHILHRFQFHSISLNEFFLSNQSINPFNHWNILLVCRRKSLVISRTIIIIIIIIVCCHDSQSHFLSHRFGRLCIGVSLYPHKLQFIHFFKKIINSFSSPK